MISELKTELKKVKTENKEIKDKVAYLESVTISCKNRISYLENLAGLNLGEPGLTDLEIVNSFQVLVSNDLDMVQELEDIGLDARGHPIELLPDLIHVCDVDGNVVG